MYPNDVCVQKAPRNRGIDLASRLATDWDGGEESEKSSSFLLFFLLFQICIDGLESGVW